jgi:hypothetical protein
MQHGEADAIEKEMLPSVALVPGDPVRGKLVQKFVIERIGHLLARLHHESGPDSGEDGGDPTKVVGMGMGDECDAELVNAVPGEEWKDNLPPCIVVLPPGTGIDQDPMAGRSPQQSTITLAHVEKM